MAFIVRKTKHRAWPVTVTLLVGDDAGQVQAVKNTFVAHFRPFSEAEFDALVTRIAADDPPCLEPLPEVDEVLAPDLAPFEVAFERGELALTAEDADERPLLSVILRRNAELFGSLIVGWGAEVRDEQGVSIPFSRATLAEMVTGADGVAISAGINTALGELRFGVAPAKNAETSPAPGPMAGADEAAPTN